MISRITITLFFLLTFAFQVALAQELPRSSNSALGWLKKMADAPSQHNYSGIFVYYANGHIETTRIIHKTDEVGQHEKIESLDGIQRIIFRNNDEMKCYLPDSKKIYTEKRWFRKYFPNLIPSSLEEIDNNYYAKETRIERVSNHECQVLTLIPRDSLRYSYQFCIDTKTGLLIKVVVSDDDEIVEQFSFVQLEINREISSDLLLSNHSMATEDWEKIDLITSISEDNELKWQVNNLPAGFKKIAEMRRSLIEKSVLVDHIALSDGLATVSIFIEPIGDASKPVLGFFTSGGAINIYVRILDDRKVTTIGEVPLEAIKLIGDSVLKKD